ncbi:hypothetical protein [Pedobacter alpinus]|uniref:Uncharacterized protein n=1 Tax=Pedobacter alpinus TaxID=1590643 RepID=A0ABW5TU42_9SPHI
MELHLDIDFKQLVQIVKQLPKQKWEKLRSEVEQGKKTVSKSSDLENFLLSAPTFSQEELNKVSDARIEINQWRS